LLFVSSTAASSSSASSSRVDSNEAIYDNVWNLQEQIEKFRPAPEQRSIDDQLDSRSMVSMSVDEDEEDVE
jgi:hypothetical protein